uniref:Protein transport protein Sec61 subunit beta n=1 Tax=Pelusios castaneus TaxID=367368 RepID=A0A8C8VJE1_9SAUR
MPISTSGAVVGASSGRAVWPKGAGWSVKQRKNNSSGKLNAGLSTSSSTTKGVWSFYTDASHGLKIGPFTVLIISILFIAFVVILHIWSKYSHS